MREITAGDLKGEVPRIRLVHEGGKPSLKPSAAGRGRRDLYESALVLRYLGSVATHVLNRFHLPTTLDQIEDNTGLSKARIKDILGDLENLRLVGMERVDGGVFAGLTGAGKRLFLDALRGPAAPRKRRVGGRA